METQPVRVDEVKHEEDLALCRATLYSALALGFRPPTEQAVKRLGSQDGIEGLADAAAFLNHDGSATLSTGIGSLGRKARSLALLSASFAKLFGHTSRGIVSAYETEYGAESIFQQPHDLADLTGFYLAFGLRVNVHERERADHISCECEFLSFLALKEAYALAIGDSSMLEEVRKAIRLFLRDHVARFVPAFTRALKTADDEGFYGTLAVLCFEFVVQECRRLNVPLGLESLGLRPVKDDGAPMACGDGGECNAIPGVFDPANSDRV